jgi:hypothetical protein
MLTYIYYKALAGKMISIQCWIIYCWKLITSYTAASTPPGRSVAHPPFTSTPRSVNVPSKSVLCLLYLAFSIHAQVAPDKVASLSVFPVFSAFDSSPFSCGLVADFLKDWSKSAIMSSICSVPTEIRMRSSVTPLLVRSSSLSCSWVVVHGWIASVLESPTLQQD